jgi:hypothetical protein
MAFCRAGLKACKRCRLPGALSRDPNRVKLKRGHQSRRRFPRQQEEGNIGKSMAGENSRVARDFEGGIFDP